MVIRSLVYRYHYAGRLGSDMDWKCHWGNLPQVLLALFICVLLTHHCNVCKTILAVLPWNFTPILLRAGYRMQLCNRRDRPAMHWASRCVIVLAKCRGLILLFVHINDLARVGQRKGIENP